MAEELRAARLEDCGAIADLARIANPAPWSAVAFAETLARARGLVCWKQGEALAGYVVFSIAADQCEILDVAVAPQVRRRGVGRRLLRGALAEAAHDGARCCHLEVRASNIVAQALYSALGFVLDGRRRAYYGDDAGAREDALLMRKEITEAR